MNFYLKFRASLPKIYPFLKTLNITEFKFSVPDLDPLYDKKCLHRIRSVPNAPYRIRNFELERSLFIRKRERGEQTHLSVLCLLWLPPGRTMGPPSRWQRDRER